MDPIREQVRQLKEEGVSSAVIHDVLGTKMTSEQLDAVLDDDNDVLTDVEESVVKYSVDGRTWVKNQ
ncbi:hypothetical protein [Desertibacillus haloalkaliphilus]|uniref:hypothetical protein n=1 Tax=Desertibacillus haloalkaliphilus TaxID=1328930 RepID=UPI001C2568D9|nr:hypothetical protein [Desertibacillus haloalkaliphilus]MBU8907837.1 hypothetical protein [Desertibacillus haloalkaliphilus]